MNVNTSPPLTGLARRLVHDGILDEHVARSALQDSRQRKEQFVAHLVERNLADSLRVAEAASDEFGTPLLDLAAFNMDVAPKNLVDAKLVEKHHTIPLFRRGNRLYLAVSDPTNLHALDEIKFHTGISTEAILVDESALPRVLQKPLGSLLPGLRRKTPPAWPSGAWRGSGSRTSISRAKEGPRPTRTARSGPMPTRRRSCVSCTR